ncbi:MAG: methyl-accepting chemotaxis protein [Defluviitaleaceae bacterium]|nr:methyl-accepting chemotaxis protein [Defluviitaleaceae bacterium]MCL2275911.1 methyl-accepting chemotaxis protein [Defluviitaleaceae bacterium]
MMNKTLWKLQSIGERCWMLANLSAQQAATLDLRGIAVVADETRKMANKINEWVERALFDEAEIEPEKISQIAFNLNMLALNSAIESHNIGVRGKSAAVCADDIRNLANEAALLLGENEPAVPASYPIPKHPLTSIEQGQPFIQFDLGGVIAFEPLGNIKEVIWYYVGEGSTPTHMNLRGQMLPLVEPFARLNAPAPRMHVILRTPWAAQNKTYAVAADVINIFACPIGTPVPASADMPLAKHVRECWDNENGAPFYFMDWADMAQ